MPVPPPFDDAFRAALRDLIAWRRDVRRFRRDALPAGRLEALIAACCAAPSVGLSQPWRFVIVEAPERRAAILDEFRRSNAAALADFSGDSATDYARLKLAGLGEAPAHMAVFAERGTAIGRGLGQRTMPETADYSVVLAIQTLWLLARAEGIGLGWVSILDPAMVAKILDVPPEWRFIGYLCLGYPAAPDDTPELERAGWERRRKAEEFIFRR